MTRSLWVPAVLCALIASPLLSQESPGLAADLSDEQKEEFLLRAKLVKTRGVPVGINNTKRLTLSDDQLTHDAHLNTVDIYKSSMPLPSGTELNFRDCYQFNIAAYKLDRLLNLNIVPVTVERRIGGNRGSVAWWVDDVQMMEKERYQKKITPPDQEDWNDQIYQVRVLNQLVYNIDPNLGNLLITNDWKVRAVDFTRAFRIHKKLQNPKELVKIDRRVYDGLRNLDEETLMRELKSCLRKPEIRALVARRDQILKYFDDLIAKQGEEAVICDRPGH